ncbi:MAG: glycosyltransferase family 4 protein [Cyanobacteriota bacterium]|nr:glycosyltransferase family 4 protein [Cyanobacteriota bacterium]
MCLDPGVPVFGNKGCSVHVQEILRAMLRQGFSITLLAARLGGDTPPGLEPIKVIPLPRLPRQDDPDFLPMVDRLAQETKAALAERADLDLIYERYSLWSCAAMEFSRSHGIVSCLEVNAPLIYEQETYREMHHRSLASELSQRALRAAHSVVTVSRPLQQMILDEDPALANVHVIANGVDTRRFYPPPARHNTDGIRPLVIGFSGTLKAWHGVEDLLAAFALHRSHFPNHQLRIIGDGPQRANLETRIRALNLEANVTLTGQVESSTMPAELAELDIAVAPYPQLSKMYFSPLKIYEYMAMGLCTVASSAGDIPQIIEDGRTGLIYRAGEIEELASCLGRLTMQPELRASLGRQAREHAEESYSWDQVLSASLNTLSRVSVR